MEEKRKKVERNVVGSITPKKREKPIVPLLKETPTELKSPDKSKIETKEETKQETESSKTVLKFVKLCDGSKQEEQKEIGDRVMVFNKKLNSVVPLNVESITFENKNLDLYSISLSPKPEFLVQLDEKNTDLYLIQHNVCDARAGRCYFSVADCGRAGCLDCGKNSPNCVNCGGAATTTCLPPI